MIDSRAIRFFQSLSRLNNSDNDFFTAVSDIPLDQVHEMYTLAKTVKVTPRIQKKYTWYRNDATGNLNQKDLFNVDGIPVHEHYGKVFKNEQLPENLESGTYIYTKEYNSNAVKIEWLPEYEPFKNALKIFNKNKNQMLEIEPMKQIVKKKKMFVYVHLGFWQCMDTLRDKILLNKLWKNKPVWKLWKT